LKNPHQIFQEKTFSYDEEGTWARSTLTMKSGKTLHRRRYFPVGIHFIAWSLPPRYYTIVRIADFIGGPYTVSLVSHPLLALL